MTADMIRASLLARATDESRGQARTKSAARTWFGFAMFRSLGRRSRGRSRKNLVAMGSWDTIRFEPQWRRRGSISARRISGIRRGPGKGQAVTNASRCRIKTGPCLLSLPKWAGLSGRSTLAVPDARQPALARPDQRELFEPQGRSSISRRWSIADSKKASNFFKDML